MKERSMNAATHPSIVRRSVNAVLVTGAILLVAAVQTGLGQTLGLGDRPAFWLLFVIGLTMCTRGPLGRGARYGWGNLRHLIGYSLGAAALLLGAAVLFDFSLPGVASARAAVLALALVMVIKAGAARLYPHDRI